MISGGFIGVTGVFRKVFGEFLEDSRSVIWVSGGFKSILRRLKDFPDNFRSVSEHFRRFQEVPRTF